MNSLKNYIQFNKQRCIAGIILAVLSFIVCALYEAWWSASFYALLFALSGLVKLSSPKTWLSYILFALWTGITVWLVKIAPAYTLNLVNNTWETKDILFLNYLCILLSMVSVFTVSIKPKLSVCIGSFILLFLTIINGFLYEFRGRELGFMDILSIPTAINVINNYHPALTLNMLYVILSWVAVLFVGLGLPKLPKLPHLLPRVAGVLALIGILLPLKFNTVDIPIKTWASEGTRLNGFYLNVYMTVRDSSMKKPKNYHAANVEQIAQQYLASEQMEENAKRPNVIIIMNESFADLRQFGDLCTTQTLTPFIDSLSENTIRGKALSSVFGGNTANSEFEVLTGHSMSFFPDFSVPYQQYIHKETHNLTNVMESYGYKTMGTHPYWNNGWSRNTIYPYFGFDKITFSEAYANNYPLRYYTSDRDMFEYILENLADKEDDRPLFLFGVTMQNHGGYDYNGDNFVERIQFTQSEGEYPLATQYINLLNETDKAVKYFINQLKRQKEPTIVLFFGDHLPQLEKDFYTDLYGGNFKTLPEQQLHYTVPFFIWANYDIPEETIFCTSLNYLSVHLLEAAGLPLSPYQRFLADTETIIPALNHSGFYSKEQETFIPYNEASPKEQEALNRYQSLVYNHLFDRRHKNTIFFP